MGNDNLAAFNKLGRKQFGPIGSFSGKSVIIGNGRLDFKKFIAVTRGGQRVALSPQALATAQTDVVSESINKGQVIYGINTGFGSLKDIRIKQESLLALQHNIVVSHDVSCGSDLSPNIVRGMQLVRLEALAQGHSGVSEKTLSVLEQVINAGIVPFIGERGSVGASGDLSPLAALARVLIGDSRKKVLFQGEMMDAASALTKAGISPAKLQAKEGLALTNGTSLMTSYLANSLFDIYILFKNALIINNMVFEAMLATDNALEPEIHQLRNQEGQQIVAAAQRSLLKATSGNNIFINNTRKVQDMYSLRCTPQILGGFWDLISYAVNVCHRELNAVTDNPLFLSSKKQWVSGGNFQGMPLSMVLDYLAIGLSSTIGNLFAAQASSLIDSNHNNGLPSCLVHPDGDLGLDSSHMIPQYLIAALASDLRRLASPSSVHNIPTCGNVEDIVSMGPNSGRKLQEAINTTFLIETAHLSLAVQALLVRREIMLKVLGEVVTKLEKGKTDAPRALEELAANPFYGYLLDKEFEGISLGTYLREYKKVPALPFSDATTAVLGLVDKVTGSSLPLKHDGDADFPQLYEKVLPVLKNGDIIKAVAENH